MCYSALQYEPNEARQHLWAELEGRPGLVDITMLCHRGDAAANWSYVRKPLVDFILRHKRAGGKSARYYVETQGGKNQCVEYVKAMDGLPQPPGQQPPPSALGARRGSVGGGKASAGAAAGPGTDVGSRSDVVRAPRAVSGGKGKGRLSDGGTTRVHDGIEWVETDIAPEKVRNVLASYPAEWHKREADPNCPACKWPARVCRRHGGIGP
jgi:hypothetical protein